MYALPIEIVRWLYTIYEILLIKLLDKSRIYFNQIFLVKSKESYRMLVFRYYNLTLNHGLDQRANLIKVGLIIQGQFKRLFSTTIAIVTNSNDYM
jgi:hypothetical protein